MTCFCLFGELSYFKEYVWNLGAKHCQIVPGKCNVGRIVFQEFNVRHKML